jgi:hypothetical protein
VREWFKLRPEYAKFLTLYNPDSLLAHRRVGDYPGTGFVVVSEQSYRDAASNFGYDPASISWVTEETPTFIPAIPPEFSFLSDFIRMMRCKALFRGNSTFSWWAATLGNAKVYAPIIKGKCGGMEHDCEFVEGNWPQMAELDFLSDLHLKEE